MCGLPLTSDYMLVASIVDRLGAFAQTVKVHF
jgi:hypothetical protein